MLWLNGHAGFGKTILCAHITHHIRDVLKRPAVFFFLSAQSGGRDDPYAIFQSWVAQLTNQDNDALEIAWEHWVSSEASTTATHAELVSSLKSILSIKLDAILIVDGLDECTAPGRDSGILASIIRDLQTSMSGSTRILITSRDTHELRRTVMNPNDGVQATELVIMPHHLLDDNMAVAVAMIEAKYPGSKKSADTKETLASKLSSKCAGQMQWLKLQKSPLEQARNQPQVESLIEQTPAELFDCYETIWQTIMARPNRREIIALLRWVAYAKRPLAVGELAEAILIDDASQSLRLDEYPDEVIDDLYLENVFPDLGQLLKVLKDPGAPPSEYTLAFNHFTVNEFLCSHIPIAEPLNEPLTHPDRSPSANLSADRLHHLALARMCLVYLQQPGVFDISEQAGAKLTPHFGSRFRDYALHGWYQHIGPEPGVVDDRTRALVLGFMSPTNPAWKPWTIRFNMALTYRDPSDSPSLIPNPWLGPRQRSSSTTEVHLAALELHGVSFPGMWQGRRNLAAPSAGTYSAAAGPLHYSVLFQLTTILADQAREKGPAYQCSLLEFSALHFAAEWPHLPSVKVLLEHKTHHDLPSYDGTPLHMAAGCGNLAVTEILLKQGADPLLLDPRSRPPVCLAATNGHLETVKYLANYEPTVTDLSRYREDTLVPIFCQDADISYGPEGPFLHKRLLESHARAVWTIRRNILAHGVLSHDDAQTTKTILDAIRDGNLILTKLLLEQVMPLPGEGMNEGQTPLHVAAIYGRPGIMQALLQNNRCVALINAKDDEGRTPLLVACKAGRLVAARLLLKAGARVDVADHKGRLPIHELHSSARHDLYHETQNLLREEIRGPDGVLVGINSQDARGYTPLHCLALHGVCIDGFKILLEAGAQPDIMAPLGGLPLHIMARNEIPLQEVDTFLRFCSDQHGISFVKGMVNQPDFAGRTPLFLACCSARPWAVYNDVSDSASGIKLQFTALKSIVGLLLHYGADPSRPNCFGVSPLEAVVSTGDRARHTVYLLSHHGAEINSTEASSGVPLLTRAKGSPLIQSFLLSLAKARGITLGEPSVIEDKIIDPATGLPERRAYERCDACLIFVDCKYECQASDEYHFKICEDCASAKKFCPAEGHDNMGLLIDLY